MKNQKWLIIKALIVAFAILNVACFFLYNIPQRQEDESFSTDYKRPSNSFFSNITEGFSIGFNNNDGFNNKDDYIEGTTNIDGLVMGSSHLEGYQVLPKDNMVNILNSNSDMYFYNISVSEHKLTNCIYNLENAIKKYKPKKYVVIETMDVSFYDDEIEFAKTNNLSANSSRLTNFLQNFKYIKLLNYQINNVFPSTKYDSVNNKKLLTDMISYGSKICENANLKLIIVFHPHFEIDNNNDIVWLYNYDDFDTMQGICKDNNVVLLNLKDSFLEAYTDKRIIPYGFNNSKPGFGHLNKNGQKIMAEEILEYIGESYEY